MISQLCFCNPKGVGTLISAMVLGTLFPSSLQAAVNGLIPGTTYYFAVTTFTPSHADNDNAVTSAFSNEVVAATSSGTLRLYVNADASGPEDGLSWATAFSNLQDALDIALPGYEIWVAAGVYVPTDGVARTAAFQLKNGVAIYGGFAGIETSREQRDFITHITVLSGDIEGNDVTDDYGVVTHPADIVGDNVYHVVTGTGVNRTAILDGLTITAGSAYGTESDDDHRGGGMALFTGSPTLTNVSFSGNSAEWNGGGVALFAGSPTLTNVSFSDNYVEWNGGGMYNDSGTPILTDVSFNDNVAANGEGGGMSNEFGTPMLTDVSFNGNAAGGDGGGMFNSDSTSTLTGVSFSGNSSDGRGGGMHNIAVFTSISATLTDVTFIANSALYGGGMFNFDTSTTLTDVSFDGNLAEYEGGGILNLGVYISSAAALTDVTFIANSAAAGGGIANFGDYLPINPILTDVAFIDNSAGDGGGMFNANDSNPTLINVTFIANSADYGGGMYNYNGNSPTLINVTFSANRADDGGGIHNNYSDPTLGNCILWDNFAGSAGDQISNSHSTPVISYSLIQISGGGSAWDPALGSDGGDNLDADPLFTRNPAPGPDGIWGTPDDDYGDLTPSAASPVVDDGNNCNVTVAYDMAGNPRIIDGNGDGNAIVDMGAYEFIPYRMQTP